VVGAAGLILATDSAVDDAMAHAAAQSLGVVWLQHALSRIVGRKPVDPSAALKARIERTVITENASAHSDEHRRAWVALRDQEPDAPWRTRVFRRWDARLDRRVCAVCLFHDAEETQIGKSFRQGHEPGSVHPGCRCMSTIVFFPASATIITSRDSEAA
jgi:hypothetical protein